MKHPTIKLGHKVRRILNTPSVNGGTWIDLLFYQLTEIATDEAVDVKTRLAVAELLIKVGYSMPSMVKQASAPRFEGVNIVEIEPSPDMPPLATEEPPLE